MGGGQMVAADFILTPDVVFSENNAGGVGGAVGGLLGGKAAAVAGGLKFKEAQTSMLVADSRSRRPGGGGRGQHEESGPAARRRASSAAAAARRPAATATRTRARSSPPRSWTTTTRSSASSATIRACSATSARSSRKRPAGGTRKAGAVFNEGDVLGPKIANVKLMAEPSDTAKVVATLGTRRRARRGRRGEERLRPGPGLDRERLGQDRARQQTLRILIGGVPRKASTMPTRFALPPPIEPMLAKLAESLPSGGGFLFEPKWDGFRAIVFRGDDDVYIQSRDLRPLDRYFPGASRGASRDSCRPDASSTAKSSSPRRAGSTSTRCSFVFIRRRPVSRSSRRPHPASFVAFDLLAADGRDVRREPQSVDDRAPRATARPGEAADPSDAGDARRRRSPPSGSRGSKAPASTASSRSRRTGAYDPGQARDDQDQARADRRLRGRGLPVAQERPQRARRIAAARVVRRRRAASRRRHVVVHHDRAQAAGARARAAARARPRRASVARVGHGRR